ncbi:hypothetical protein Lal_00004011, partial [Lupinus albus]
KYMTSNEPELPTSQEASTENTSTSSYRTKSDPAWAHCKQVVAENGKTVLLCLFYIKQIKGGEITRFKAQLAGVKGQVEKCKKVPANIQHQVQKSIDEMKSKKRKVEDEFKDGNPCDEVTYLLHTQSIETPRTSTSQKGKGRISSYFMPRTTPGAQPTLKSVISDFLCVFLAAGRLLEKEFPHLFWSPCAAHCVNLMFQDIGKLPEVTDTVSHAANITKYLYNHCHPLYLMRQFTNGKEILRPAPTRFATNFIALQSILAQKDALRALVTSRECTSSTYSKDVKEKKCVEQVLDSNFWKQCADIVKITELLVRMLRIVDCEDKSAMGFLYQAFFKARHEMERRFQRNKTKIKPYLEIMDSRLKNLKNISSQHPVFWMFLNPDLLDKLTSEMRIYKDVEFDFGRPTVIRERSKVMSDQWWETYGCRTLNLQKLAVCVLSQTCSASGCERNWSVFEHIHTNKRNRLEHQKFNDLVFVRYNLRLQQRSHLRHQNYDPINLEIFEDHSHFILEESPPFLTVEEIEALRNNLANISIQPSLNDNDQLNLEDDDDDDAQLNPMENVNLDEDNVGQASGSNDEEIDPRCETTLTPWC